MQRDFWQNLTRPFFVQAPLENVTDAAFRAMIATYGKPQVMFTEFTSADGLCSSGHDSVVKNLQFCDNERPIVAQLFSADPEKIARASAEAAALGFDGIDINMGCPDKAVCKSGAGAALINDPKRAQSIIRAAQKAAPDLPISIKTRLGYNQDTLETWLPQILETSPAAVTIHARTKKELSLVPARWERIAAAVEIVRASGLTTAVIGNGDAINLTDAREKAAQSGCDGVMLGRALFGNPWLFAELQEVSPEERITAMVKHAQLFEEYFSGIKSFAVMRKHIAAYISGFDGAKQLRIKLMTAENSAEVARLAAEYLPQA